MGSSLQGIRGQVVRVPAGIEPQLANVSVAGDVVNVLLIFVRGLVSGDSQTGDNLHCAFGSQLPFPR